MGGGVLKDLCQVLARFAQEECEDENAERKFIDGRLDI